LKTKEDDSQELWRPQFAYWERVSTAWKKIPYSGEPRVWARKRQQEGIEFKTETILKKPLSGNASRRKADPRQCPQKSRGAASKTKKDKKPDGKDRKTRSGGCRHRSGSTSLKTIEE